MLSILATNLSYSFFFTTLFFTTDNLLKYTGTGTNLSISSLSTLVFRLAKFDFSPKVLILICDIFLKSVFVG